MPEVTVWEEAHAKLKEAEERIKEARETMAKFKPGMDKIREAIEDAKSALNEVGEFDIEIEGDEYVIRLSQNVKGRIKFDPRTGKIPIMLHDDSLWWQGPDGRWDRRTLDMQVDRIVQPYESRREAQWLKEEIGRILRVNSPVTQDRTRWRGSSRQLTAAHGSSRRRAGSCSTMKTR